MKLPSWLRAIFAPQEPLPVHRPRFASICVQCGGICEHGKRCDTCKVRNIVDWLKPTDEEIEAEIRWQRNFTLTPEQRRQRSLKAAETVRAKKEAQA